MPAFVDTNNLYYSLRKKFGPDARLDYAKFLQALDTDRVIAYVANRTDTTYRFADMLRNLGCIVKIKQPIKRGKYTFVDWNVEIACDLMSAEKTEKLIVCSSDILLLAVLESIPHVHVFAANIPKAFKNHATTQEIPHKMLVDHNE